MNEPLIRDKAIIAGMLDSYWAMEPQILGRMTEVIMRHAQGIKLDASEINEIVAARGDGGHTETKLWRRGATAIIPVTGVLVKHSYLVNGESQPRGTATLDIRKKLDAAMDDPSVEKIVLLIDSPGGSVYGISDLAQAIRRADEAKPVYAMAEDMAASAAYWLASQTRRIFVNDTGMVGSIGVYTVLMDSSRRADREGFRVEVVKAGQHKAIGEPGTAITSADRAVVQERIDSLYSLFVDAVAGGRRMDGETIRLLADGRVHTGRAAIDAGLADEISTLEDLLASLEGNTRLFGGTNGSARRANSTVAAGDRESEMTKENEPSPQTTPAADADAIRTAAVKEANEAAAKRVTELTAALGGRTELLMKAIGEGMTVTQAKAELADTLAAECEKLAGELKAAGEAKVAVETELAVMKELVAKSGIKPVEAGTKKDDDAGDGDGGYEAKVAELTAAGQKEPRARINASKEFPEAHKAWLKTQQPK